MIGSLGNRLRIVLRQPDDSELADPAPVDDADGLAELDFVAYAEDGRLSGKIRLDAARLSDMLNDHDEFLLEDVLAEHLPEGGTLVVPEFLVQRDELLLVYASGPRGDKTRRTRTQAQTLAIRIGPYLVSGDVHIAAGIEPLVWFRRRKPMVPLTDAVIEYRGPEGTVREYADTIIVNRQVLDWVQPVEAGAGLAGISGIANGGTTAPR